MSMIIASFFWYLNAVAAVTLSGWTFKRLSCFFRSSPVHIFGNSNSLHSYARPPLASSAPNPSRSHLRERRRVRVTYHFSPLKKNAGSVNSYWQIGELFSTGQQWIWVWSFLNVFIFFWRWRHGLVSVLALYSLALFPERYAHTLTFFFCFFFF